MGISKSTWSLTLREERRVTVFQSVLRRIVGPYRDEVSGECGKIRDEKLNDFIVLI